MESESSPTTALRTFAEISRSASFSAWSVGTWVAALRSRSLRAVLSASAVAGYPHITVPAGYVFGLPVGISFFGGAYSEPKLIKIAYAFEQATMVRRSPQFLSTARFS